MNKETDASTTALENYKEHSDEKVTGRMTPYHTRCVLTSLRPAIPSKRQNTYRSDQPAKHATVDSEKIKETEHVLFIDARPGGLRVTCVTLFTFNLDLHRARGDISTGSQEGMKQK
ncbi:hypothetical protein ILYODFUR_004858 [Ilyodon furcidens]|uniref:Uncharacterized protein n=1 Tax=Ilyodon furcidens TaxID=33524 RepID=A0ABV0TJQ4_9TELE